MPRYAHAAPTSVTEGLSAAIVHDPEGALFARVRTLPLGVAVWRTTLDPLELRPAPTTLIVFATGRSPDWARIRSCAGVAPTIVAAAGASSEHALDALALGAFGYLDLTVSDDALCRTLLAALRGEPVYPRSTIGAWMREARPTARSSRSEIDKLTARQRRVVELIASGSTDSDIASVLGICTATAQKHVANVLRRLQVRNRAAAVSVVLADAPLSPSLYRWDTPRR